MSDSERLLKPKTELRRIGGAFIYDAHVGINTASAQLPDLSEERRKELVKTLDNIFHERPVKDVASAMEIINEQIRLAEEVKKTVPITSRLVALRDLVLGVFL